MDVFVYGTLTNPDRVRTVLDSFVFVGPAVLEGLRVVDGEYPTLVPPAEGSSGRTSDPGGPTDRTSDPGRPTDRTSDAGEPNDWTSGAEVAGRLLRTDEVTALDAYEGVDEGLYVRVTVPVVDEGAVAGEGPTGTDEAAVYVGDPERLDAPATWPGTGPFGERVVAGVDTRGVRVRIPPTG